MIDRHDQAQPRLIRAEPDYYYELDEGEPLRSRAIPVVQHYWQVAKNNKWLIAAIVLLALLIGVLSYLLSTPQFQSTSRIEISRVENNVTEVEEVQVEDTLRDNQYFETQYELLRARSLAERVVREEGLAEDEAFFMAFGIKDLAVGDSERRATNVLLANVNIAAVVGSNLVDIQFTSPDPALAARIANAWAEAFIASNLDRRFGATVEAREFLEGRIAGLRERLEDSERALITYAANRDLFTIETPADGDSERTAAQTLVATDLQTLNAELAAATADRISAEAALQAGPNNSPNGADPASALRARRAELVGQRAQLLTQFGPEYPQVEALSAQISELDRAIVNERGVATNNARSDASATFAQARAREAQLRERVNELRSQFVQQRRDSVQYNILAREVDTNRELYNALLQRYREIGVAGVGENNVAIVDLAQVPSIPVEPNLFRTLLMSLLIGGAIAGGVLFLREQIDQSIRDPKQLPDELGVPLLGSIPKQEGTDLGSVLADPKTELYEAYFSLVTNLSFLTESGVPDKLVLTSSRPEEGKSLSGVALAYILAKQGKRTLLIDADMRHSGLEKYVDVPEGKGLAHYLAGDDEWRSMPHKNERFGFDLLTSGFMPPNAGELLATGRFSKLLAELEGTYDKVIIDGPPVLGLADSPLIAAAGDGVVLLAEANGPSVRSIASALERLRQGKARIFGGAVTKLDDRNAAYGYGGGYGYGYGYGSEAA